MNVLIATDMEGVAGIDGYGDCLPSHPAAYAEGRAPMAAEVLAAEGFRCLRPAATAGSAIATTFRSSQVSREYRQMAKLFPAEGSRLRSLHRRAGGLLATPVMRSKERRWLAASA